MSKNTFPLEGNLTRDPELRRTQNGNAVCSFGWALANDENKAVAFVTGVAWGEDAEEIATKAKKGDLLKMEVRVNTRTYENAEGVKVWVTEFVKPSDGKFKITKRKATNGNNQEKPPKSNNDENF